MKIAITGLSSFIGKKLISKLGQEVDILSIGRKNIHSSIKNIQFLSLNDKDIASEITKFKPDIFLNIASDYRYEINEVETYYDITSFNIAMSSFLIDVSILAGVKLIINISSNWAYLGDSISPKFLNYYAFTKFALDKYIQNASQNNNCRSISLILYDNFDKYDSRKKIFNLILESIDKQVKQDFSPGKQIKNFTRMEDIADAIKFSVFYDWDLENHEFYQITGFETSIFDLSKQMAFILNKSVEFLRFGKLPYRDGELMKPRYIFKELPFIGERKNNLRELLKKELMR